jgi:2-C-methyl-D-erythritol 4-phosphate cytidylyltransferase
MAGAQPKQFLALNGIPILIHSLRAFASVARLPASTWPCANRRWSAWKPRSPNTAWPTGSAWSKAATTARNPYPTPRRLPAEFDDIVLVHDAVRPLIDAATIERTIEAVDIHGAAIVGLPAVDTIKQVERTAHGALVVSTIPREFVVLAQTPQGFRFGILQRAFAEAMATALSAPTKHP